MSLSGFLQPVNVSRQRCAAADADVTTILELLDLFLVDRLRSSVDADVVSDVGRAEVTGASGGRDRGGDGDR
jgi:hypothetical protein